MVHSVKAVVFESPLVSLRAKRDTQSSVAFTIGNFDEENIKQKTEEKNGVKYGLFKGIMVIIALFIVFICIVVIDKNDPRKLIDSLMNSNYLNLNK